MHVFLSHSHADRKLAATLRGRLESEGLTVSSLDRDPRSAGWHRDLEEALRSAAAILLLVSPQVDEPQRTTWRLALEAVWADPSKRLIPILLQDAELPAFVKSASSGAEVQAIRLRDPRDLDPVIQAILRTLGVHSGEEPARTRGIERFEIREKPSGSYDVIPDRGPSKPPRSFDVITDSGPIETYPAVTDEDRARQREDFAAIRKYAEQLKH
jgi:hypothetical protein